MNDLKIKAATIGAAYLDGMLSAEATYLLRYSEDGLPDSGFVFWAIEAVDVAGNDPDEVWIEGWDPIADPDHHHHVIVNTATGEEVRPIEHKELVLVARPVATPKGESFAIESDGTVCGYASRPDGATTWTLTTSNGLPLGHSPSTLTDAIYYIGEWVDFVECVLNNLEDE